MNGYRDDLYVRKVDEMTARLRKYLLGHTLQFTAFLPSALVGEPEKAKADYLTDQLLFCIATALPLGDENLPNIRAWLYNIILYLLTQCGSADWTFENILKLSDLPLHTRQGVFVGEDFCNSIVAKASVSPISRNSLEAAIVSLINCSKTTLQGEDLLTRITTELNALRVY